MRRSKGLAGSLAVLVLSVPLLFTGSFTTYARTGPVSFASSSGATIFVAEPGKGFGPIKLGSPPPLSPTVICEDSTLGIKMYLAELGLMVVIRNQRDSETTGLPANVISGIEAERIVEFNPSVFYVLHDRGCKLRGGKAVTKPMTFPLPRNITYITHRSVGIGATLENVLAAHGAPRETVNSEGPHGNIVGVAAVAYCGMWLDFSAGKVEGITVVGVEEFDSTGRVKGRCRPR